MTAGLEVYDAVSVLVSRVTDRLSKLITSGTVNIGIGGSTFVGVSGMTGNNDQWFIACSHGNIAVPGTNGFTIYQTGEYSGPYNYSVFRW